jgi:NADH-quinone oxidoreductase subunit L
MIFRAFFGEPCEEARELEHGHLAHAEVPTNPMTGETEDTDVGFPGPEHFIAEREWPMKLAMSVLAVLALIGGVTQIPGIDNGITRFLSTTFADSTLARHEPANGSAWIGLVIGAIVAVVAIAIAYRIWVLRPAIAVAARARFKAIYTFLYNKWYFDELIDVLIVQPTLWFGRFAESVLERVVIGGGVTGGATAIVRATSAAVRRAQTGFLRFYAAAMIVCLSGVALYFLITSS